MTHDNTNKSRDLKQALEKINNSYKTFSNRGVIYCMERTEVEGLIQQAERLSEKIKKYVSIYSTDKSWLN